MFEANAITGGMSFDVSEFTEGMLHVQALSHAFPALVVEFLEAPLTTMVSVAKEAFHALSEVVSEVGEKWDNMGRESGKLGLDPQVFSSWVAAAKPDDVSADALANGLRFMLDKAANALRGDRSGAKMFQDLGISADSLKDMIGNPEQLFYAVADGFHHMGSAAQRTQAAMDWGKAGATLIPFLSQGSESIKKLSQQMIDLGGAVSSSQADVGDKWSKMGGFFSAAWDGIKAAIAEPILTVLADNFDAIVESVVNVSHWLREGIGGAMATIMPIAQSLWGVVSGLAGALGPVLGAALALVTPMLQVLAGVLRVIADLAGGALNSVAAVIHALTGDAAGADRFAAAAGAAMNRLPGDAGLGGPPTVTVENVNVTMDHKESALQIAQKIQPSIKAGYEQLHQDAVASVKQAKVHRGITGGKHH